MNTIFTSAFLGLFLLSNQGAAVAAQPALAPVQYHVAMTGYNAVPEQTDESPFVTASGAYSDPDIVVARSVDLADDLPFGTVIEVVPGTTTPTCGVGLVNDFIGLRVVADSMHPRKRNQIDILFHADDFLKAGGRMVNPAIALGVCSDVGVRVVGHVDVNHMPKTQAELAAMIGLKPDASRAPLAYSK